MLRKEYLYKFVVEYTKNGMEYHQCFQVSGVPINCDSAEAIKSAFTEHIKNLLLINGCTPQRIWMADCDLSVEELQKLTDGKIPINSRGKLITLEERII